jgi:thiamine-monophosphate kinase
MFENKSKTDLASLGEFGLIDHLTAPAELKKKSSIKGVGDDAAVIGEGKLKTLVSTDLLMEGIHFDLGYVPLKHLGYKSITVNLSDIAAMNAVPSQITVSIGMSSRFPLEAIEELYTGIHKACEVYNVDLVGGDTSTSLSGLMISITAIGHAKDGEIAYRSGANETDLICVSGDLGAAYLGLQLMERENRIFKENPSIQPDLSGHDYILERFLKPEARTDIHDILKMEKVTPTSMIDISDGLSSDVIHICKQSKVGCIIFTERVPIDAASSMGAEELGLEPLTAALNGGEDYELLFTIPVADHNKIKDNPSITVIGHITDEASGYHLESAGQLIELKAQGWGHLEG